MSKLLVILGPTATGKTDLALFLAKKFNGEIISCDSRQVYKGLDIGTGKMPGKFESLQLEDGRWNVDGVAIHMYDVVSPKIQYTVADYVTDAGGIVEDIHHRKKLAIVVGGTGLYLKALLYGLSSLSIPVDKKLRLQLNKLSVSELQERLKQNSIKKWHNLNYSDKHNPRRLVRIIEMLMVKPKKRLTQSSFKDRSCDILKIGLTAPREVLYQRSDERALSRIKQGMVEEANRLKKMGLSLKRMRQLGLEYRCLADYLTGNIQSQADLISIMQGGIHRFIRRQLTWFKKEKDINWFNITDQDFSITMEKLVGKWYDNKNAKKN